MKLKKNEKKEIKNHQYQKKVLHYLYLSTPNNMSHDLL